MLALLAAPGSPAAEPVATVPAEYREVDLTYGADAVVEAVRQSTVSAQISGRVRDILFDVGDTVKKGQVILRIDESEVAQGLAEATAVLAQAEAGFANAKAHYERTEQLFARGFVSQAARDKAKSEFQAAHSQVAARRAAAGIASTTRGYATVVAPYSGVVLSRHVELGETVVPGKPLMTGFDPGQLRVVADLPQHKLKEIQSRAGVTVEFPVLNKSVTATEVTLQPAADLRTHATRFRLDLPAGLEDVYPGMFARARFVAGRGKKLTIPASAVLQRSEVAAVYVVDARGAVQLRQVRLGESVGNGQVEVLAGLAAGEQVALDPVKAGIQQKAVSGQPSAVGR
ncbi:MAG: efflux RND transporter periplasmic adaptor subunit [Betaproteobacteria bacterium]|nr:efflux RND transporter periplasmic adaptor subunit [Betaproteobacteria bacterium]